MDERIGYLLKRLQSILRAHMDSVLGPHGVTTPQYAALSILEAEPGISNAELARRSFVTPQTMIRIVENLEGLRLIARQQHSAHGRLLTTTLTPKGKRLVASCHADVSTIEARMLSELGPRERSALQDTLARCINALQTDA